MPWFAYNYPGDETQPNSYSLISGTPTCTGDSLCAVYATTQPGTQPARPQLTQSVLQAIEAAMEGTITEGVTKLRPASTL